MQESSLIGQRLVWAFLLGVVLLNDPVLSLVDRGQLVAGIPLIFLYLFGVWAGLIGLLGWALAQEASGAPPSAADGESEKR